MLTRVLLAVPLTWLVRKGCDDPDDCHPNEVIGQDSGNTVQLEDMAVNVESWEDVSEWADE